MNIELIEIQAEEKNQLKAMLLNYFKEIDPSKVIQKDNSDDIDYPYLDLYWEEASRIPLKILLNEEFIGFVLLNNWIVCKDFGAEKSIAEFYVEPKYRRTGIGKEIAFRLFETYKGKWEIRHSSTNNAATNFWTAIIEEFTSGNFTTRKNEGVEIIQLFDTINS